MGVKKTSDSVTENRMIQFRNDWIAGPLSRIGNKVPITIKNIFNQLQASGLSTFVSGVNTFVIEPTLLVALSIPNSKGVYVTGPNKGEREWQFPILRKILKNTFQAKTFINGIDGVTSIYRIFQALSTKAHPKIEKKIGNSEEVVSIELSSTALFLREVARPIALGVGGVASIAQCAQRWGFKIPFAQEATTFWTAAIASSILGACALYEENLFAQELRKQLDAKNSQLNCNPSAICDELYYTRLNMVAGTATVALSILNLCVYDYNWYRHGEVYNVLLRNSFFIAKVATTILPMLQRGEQRQQATHSPYGYPIETKFPLSAQECQGVSARR